MRNKNTVGYQYVQKLECFLIPAIQKAVLDSKAGIYLSNNMLLGGVCSIVY
jgi:hypothetical protein